MITFFCVFFSVFCKISDFSLCFFVKFLILVVRAHVVDAVELVLAGAAQVSVDLGQVGQHDGDGAQQKQPQVEYS